MRGAVLIASGYTCRLRFVEDSSALRTTFSVDHRRRIAKVDLLGTRSGYRPSRAGLLDRARVVSRGAAAPRCGRGDAISRLTAAAYGGERVRPRFCSCSHCRVAPVEACARVRMGRSAVNIAERIQRLRVK